MAIDHAGQCAGVATPGASRNHVPFLAGCFIIAAILPLRLLNPHVWVDEAFTFSVATAPLEDHLHLVYKAYDHPPLFFHLAWLWAQAGESIVWLRLLPMLCAMGAGMLLLREVAAESKGRMLPSLAFAVGLASAPTVLFQATNFRHYGLFLLLSVAYCTCLKRQMEGGLARTPSLSAILGGLALLTHHFAAFVLLAGESALLMEQGSERLRFAIRRALAFAPFVLGWAAVAFAQYPGSGGEGVAAAMGSYSGGVALLDFLARYHGAPLAFDVPAWAVWTSRAIGMILISSTAIALWQSRAKRRLPRLWLHVALMPPLAVFALSFFKPAMESRFLLPSGAALWVLYAMVLGASARGRVVLIAATLASASLSIWLTHTRKTSPPYNDHASQILRAVGSDGMLVLAPGAFGDVYRYYGHRDGIAMPRFFEIPSPLGSPKEYEGALAELPRALQPYKRAWVVYELPGFWEPSRGTQNWFEANRIIGPYQPLWDRRWVVTYYDSRLSGS